MQELNELSVYYCRHFTAHNHVKQTRQSGNLRRSIISVNHVLNKHDIERWFLNRNLIKGRQSNWIPYLMKEQNSFCSAVCPALSLLNKAFRAIRSSHCQHLCFVRFVASITTIDGDQTNKASASKLSWRFFFLKSDIKSFPSSTTTDTEI